MHTFSLCVPGGESAIWGSLKSPHSFCPGMEAFFSFSAQSQARVWILSCHLLSLKLEGMALTLETRAQPAFRIKPQMRLLKDHPLLLKWAKRMTLESWIFCLKKICVASLWPTKYCLLLSSLDVSYSPERRQCWEKSFYFITIHYGIIVFSFLCQYPPLFYYI